MGQAYIHNQIARVYRSDNPIKSLEYARKALSIAEEVNSKSEQAASYNLIAQVFRMQGDYPSSLDNATQSLAIYETLGDTVSIGRLLYNI